MSSVPRELGDLRLDYMVHTILCFPLLIYVSELNLLSCCLTRQLFEAIKPPLGSTMVTLTRFPVPFRHFVVCTIVFYTGVYPVSDVPQIRVDLSSPLLSSSQLALATSLSV
jgi:hypothetical protein